MSGFGWFNFFFLNFSSEIGRCEDWILPLLETCEALEV